MTVTDNAEPPDRRIAAGGQMEGASELIALTADLIADAQSLLRQEIELARGDLIASARALAISGLLMAVGAAFLAIGFLVLLAFLVIAGGRLMGGAYGLSALFVGAFLALVGAISFLAGRRGLSRDTLKPRVSLDSLRESSSWAAGEARRFQKDSKNAPE